MQDWVLGASGAEFWTEERCFITELHNSDLSPDASLALARVPPGVVTQLHSLSGVTEVYILRKGRGVIEVGGIEQRLEVGDQAVIAAGAAQRIRNDGNDDLEFYCLCTPRFRPECYVNLETG